MKLIAHRGNINGSYPKLENNPSYIEAAIDLGYDVEIDVWLVNNHFFLGHDNPQYSINDEFLINEKLWCHAKNIEALSQMLKNRKIHCFWHQTDDYTITSKGIIWAYPNRRLTENSICVLPENIQDDIPNNILGICSDYVSILK